MSGKVNVIITGKNLASPAINQVTQGLASASVGATGLNAAMLKLSKIALAGVLTTLTGAIAGLGKSISVGMNLEFVTSQFEVLTKSASTATAMISDLREFAKTTPLSFEGITQGAKTLMAFGTSSADVEKQLKMLGDVAMGDDEKLQSLVDAYGKVQSRGKASMRELNMFTYAGVPIIQALADSMGVTTQQITKMSEAGKLGFNDVNKALIRLTTNGGKFEGMMQKQNQTLKGQLQVFSDSINEEFGNLGMSILPSVKQGLKSIQTGLTDLISSDGFKNLITSTIKFMTWVSDRIPLLLVDLSFVGTVLGAVGTAIKEVFNIFRNSNIPAISFIFKPIGEMYDALKNGFQNGDWSGVFDATINLAKPIITILAAVSLTKLGIMALGSTLSNLLVGSSILFKGCAIPGILALATIGLEVAKDYQNSDFNGLAAKLIGGLTLALVGLGLTGSLQAGILMFSIGFNLIDENLAQQWDNITAEIKAWIHNWSIKEEFSNLFSTLYDMFLSDFVDRVESTNIDVSNMFSLYGTQLINNVLTTVTTIYDSIKNGFKSFSSEIYQMFLADFLDRIASFPTDLKSSITTISKAIYDFIHPEVSKYWNDFTTEFSSWITNWSVKDELSGLFGSIYNLFVSDLLDRITVDLEDSKTKLSGFFSSLYDMFLKDFVNRISQTGTDIQNVFSSIGGFIYDGILLGLTKIPGIGKWIASQLDDETRKRLGIESPSKVFKSIGQYTMEGLEMGLSSAPDIAKQAATNFSDNFTLSFDPKKTAQKSIEEYVMVFGKRIDLPVFTPKVEQPYVSTFGASMKFPESTGTATTSSGSSSFENILKEFNTTISNAYDELKKKRADILDNNGTAQKTIDDILNGGNGNGKSGESDKKDSAFIQAIKDVIGKTEIGKATGYGLSSKDSIIKIVDQLSSSFGTMLTSLTSVQAILNPISTMLQGFFEVVEPLIDTILTPLIGILKIIGQTVGKVLAPLFEVLASVTEVLGRAFVWIYNKILVPIGNALITVFNVVADIIIAVLNGVITAYNWVSWIWGGHVDTLNYRALDAGHLTTIDYSNLTAAAAGSTGTGSSTGTSSSSSSATNYTITIYQTIQGPVIGEGGKVSVGKYVAEAIEDYIGSGGRVSFVEA